MREVSDASQEPRDGNARKLERHLSIGSLAGLPAWSELAGLPLDEVVARLRGGGVTALQVTLNSPYSNAAFDLYGIASIKAAEEASTCVRSHSDAGFKASTVTVGTGFESDDERSRLVEAVLEAQQKSGYDLYLETHRATITQDIYRTLQLIEEFPDLRFNADLSHWYTGHELGSPPEDFENKLKYLDPVFKRVRYVHGRIGTNCCMQVALSDATDARYFVAHFETMWRRCFEGFLENTDSAASIGFAPELLPATLEWGGRVMHLNYARQFPDENGDLREESDRWQQSLFLFEIADRAFDAAKREWDVRSS